MLSLIEDRAEYSKLFVILLDKPTEIFNNE
jgi:hypothetical protein